MKAALGWLLIALALGPFIGILVWILGVAFVGAIVGIALITTFLICTGINLIVG